MAREILFKAKRKDNGEWVEGYYCIKKTYCFDNRTGFKTIIITEQSSTGTVSFEVNPDTICQYTGLTDKNGNNIWEKDLVQIDAYSYMECEEDAFGVLEYSDAYASFGLSLEDRFARICDLQGSYTTIYEVLGNIFDNPELLGGGE